MDKKVKTALITGATSGFGKVIAMHLVKTGYSLIVLGRSEGKLTNLIAELNGLYSGAFIQGVQCNLSSFQSINRACEEVKDSNSKIDLLLLNAGTWNFEYIETEDNIEEIFQVNLLAPVLMFEQLQSIIPRNGASKVIFTASGLHQGQIDFDNIEFKNNFSGFKAYRQSKLGVILMTRLFAKDQNNEGISFSSVHPGVVNTKLGRNAGWFSRFIFKMIGTNKEKGARTHIYLIDQPASKIESGEYYAKSRVTKTTAEAYDLKTAKRLYEVINSLLNSGQKEISNI